MPTSEKRSPKTDEFFCSSCGEIIKKAAVICPKCGVKTKKEDEGKPKASIGWLVFWIIVFWPMAIVYALIRRWNK